MMIIWSFCSFSFFLVPYYLDTIPGNLYLMSSATAIGEIIASIICLTITHRFETRKSVSFFAFVSLIATIAIVMLTSFYKGLS